MNKSHRTLFLGDSVTDCERNRAVRQPNRPDALGNGWVNRVATELLWEEPGSEVWNRGYAGCRIHELLDQPGWLPVRKKQAPAFDDITVLIGINDIWHPFNSGEPHDIDGAVAAYAAMVEQLRPLAERLTLVEPFAIAGPAVDERWWPLLDDLCGGQAEAARSAGARWLPTRQPLARVSMEEPKLWLYDGVHPGVLGHRWLAQQWLAGRE